jgi:hypothetical protein
MLNVRQRRSIVSIEQAAFAIFLRKATARRGDCSIHPCDGEVDRAFRRAMLNQLGFADII